MLEEELDKSNEKCDRLTKQLEKSKRRTNGLRNRNKRLTRELKYFRSVFRDLKVKRYWMVKSRDKRLFSQFFHLKNAFTLKNITLYRRDTKRRRKLRLNLRLLKKGKSCFHLYKIFFYPMKIHRKLQEPRVILLETKFEDENVIWLIPFKICTKNIALPLDKYQGHYFINLNHGGSRS